MDQQMKVSMKVPTFDGEDFVFWKIRMKRYLMSIGMEVWALVEEGYDVPKVTPTESEERKKYWEHAKALNTLQVGVSKLILAKVLTCMSAKQLWGKLETLYAGDSKVKKEKLQSFKVQYESLKMRDEETISEYFERI